VQQFLSSRFYNNLLTVNLEVLELIELSTELEKNRSSFEKNIRVFLKGMGL